MIVNDVCTKMKLRMSKVLGNSHLTTRCFVHARIMLNVVIVFVQTYKRFHIEIKSAWINYCESVKPSLHNYTFGLLIIFKYIIPSLFLLSLGVSVHINPSL